MRVYVAGKTNDFRTVRSVQALAKSVGHTITHDWTQAVEANGGDSNEILLSPQAKRKYAEADLLGVHAADLVIALGHPNLCGTYWECGMAAAWRIPLWQVNWDYCARASVFDCLLNVTRVEFEDLPTKLWDISEKHLEMQAPPTIRVDEWK